MTVAGYPTNMKRTYDDASWYQELPSSWSTQPIRNLFNELRIKNTNNNVKNYLSLLAKVGVIPYEDKGDIGNKCPEDLTGCKLVKINDFVINSMNFGIGSFGVSKYNGVCSSVYIILRIKEIEVLGFYRKIFEHSSFQEYSQSLGNGILAHRCAIGWDELKNIRLPAPPIDEQLAIAAFLDEKCAKIDEAIRIKEEQIKLLHERRQILIQQAVTRGLNPGVPMKDSGIDWIGQIPAHWEVKRIKHVSLLSPTRSMDGIVPSDKSVIFLPMEAISENGQIDQSNKLACRDLYSGFTYFQRGDVVIAKITPCFENGKGAWLSDLESEFGFGTTELHVLRPQSVSGSFLYRVLNTKEFRLMAEKFMTGSAGQKRVPTSFLENHQIALPPEKEQEQIINFIDSITDKHRVAVSIKDKQITTLKEYKTTLINAAVTGKIRITPDMLPTPAE